MDHTTENLHLVKPTREYEKAVMDYRGEFLRDHDNIDGSGGLTNAVSYEAWLQTSIDSENELTVPKDRVCATQYLAVRAADGDLVGMIQIRHRLNQFLEEQGGHIGYSVRKSERRKGYATEMLREALKECEKLGLKRVLITCDPLNVGSASVIKANGGIYKKQFVSMDGTKFDHYWIALD
jgi:predicted acetyltransferase